MFLTAVRMVDRKPATPVKRGLFKITRKASFRNSNARVKVFESVGKRRNFSCYFTTN